MKINIGAQDSIIDNKIRSDSVDFGQSGTLYRIKRAVTCDLVIFGKDRGETR